MKRAPGTGFLEMIFPGGTLRPNQNPHEGMVQSASHFDAGNRRTSCKLALPLPLVVLPVLWVFASIG
jgi:hypothetical protein